MDESPDYGARTKTKEYREVDYSPTMKPPIRFQALEESWGFPLTDLVSTLGQSSNKDANFLILLSKTTSRSHEIEKENTRLNEQLKQRNRLLEYISRTKAIVGILSPLGAILIGLVIFIWSSYSDSARTTSINVTCGLLALIGMLMNILPIFVIDRFKIKENEK